MTTAVADAKKTGSETSQLDQLKKFTRVVADTGDFETIKDFKPQDATTNPSLIFAATQKEQYGHLLEEVIADRKNSGLSGAAQVEDADKYLRAARGERGLAKSTVAGKAAVLAKFYEFVIVRYQGDIHEEAAEEAGAGERNCETSRSSQRRRPPLYAVMWGGLLPECAQVLSQRTRYGD